MLRDVIAQVVAGGDLTTEQAAAAMKELMSGTASPVQAAALLTALRVKGETPEEIAGFARVMREHSVRVSPQCERLVDTCGTGGGSITTFNISTTAAFAVAGAGVSVAKHGNRAMTSACGSADVLEALGVSLDRTPAQLCASIEQIGIGFLFAPVHHPAMRHVGPIRRELPFRTVFNILGPLTNPAGAGAQVIGVYEERLVPLVAQALVHLGCRRSLVVHGLDGLDELSTVGPTAVAEVRDGEVRSWQLLPEDVGLQRAEPDDIAPAEDIAGNAELMREVLSAVRSPRRDIVLLNAAAALMAADAAEDLKDGIRLAAEAIDNGAALRKLNRLVEESRPAA